MLKSVIIIAATLFAADISALSLLFDQPDYEYFHSAIYPGYGVRFVRPQLCDPNTTQYAGYLDLGANHYHFWFFESKEDPSKKPLTSFFSGGPGCTSHVAIWTENSPCKYSNVDESKIGYREQTWTNYSNMLYIDQPTISGFSYGDKIAETADKAAIVFYEAIQLFYEAFPQYSKLPYHLFGESYGGRMAVIYGNYIAEQNLKLKELSAEESNTLAPKQIIPLESVGSMSPWINPMIQTESTTKACDLTYGHLVPRRVCQEMEENFKKCKQLLQQCYDSDHTLDCAASTIYCSTKVSDVYKAQSGRNVLDMRRSSAEIIPSQDFSVIIQRPEIRKSIGVGSTPFSTCSLKTFFTMASNGEHSRNSSPAFESLLDRGVRVLVTSGDADYQGNWVGIRDSLSNLNFNGSELFNQLELKPWFVDHNEVGQVKTTEKLTFVRMYEAGHELPTDQPENSLIMFDNWVNKKDFLDK